MKFKTLPLSLSVLLAFTASPLVTYAAPAPTTSVDYDGFTYDLTTTYTSYTDNPGLLESQPW
ncbi:hypothetical protein [Porticoccus sp.]|uniref:hypothetical protein n=1 Tax=Porticoccus sp. TaxID=2024853 RepID=UPI003F696130